ncbi:hypothetical protein [Sodalis sp.]
MDARLRPVAVGILFSTLAAFEDYQLMKPSVLCCGWRSRYAAP